MGQNRPVRGGCVRKARPLSRVGEPRSTDDSTGRFFALVPRFLDPEVYAPDRRLTGAVRGSEPGLVGKHTSRYPLVEAQAWYLWPRTTEVSDCDDAPLFDP